MKQSVTSELQGHMCLDFDTGKIREDVRLGV